MVTFVIESDRVSVPEWVTDLASFRRWAESEDYPETGRICYLLIPVLETPPYGERGCVSAPRRPRGAYATPLASDICYAGLNKRGGMG
jgi:hypothetical protein